jgi:hypothetical protein
METMAMTTMMTARHRRSMILSTKTPTSSTPAISGHTARVTLGEKNASTTIFYISGMT